MKKLVKFEFSIYARELTSEGGRWQVKKRWWLKKVASFWREKIGIKNRNDTVSEVRGQHVFLFLYFTSPVSSCQIFIKEQCAVIAIICNKRW